MGTGHFFCVHCKSLLERGDAQQVFKTGYFKIVHPLGCCKSCSQEAADNASNVLDLDQIKDKLKFSNEMPDAVCYTA